MAGDWIAYDHDLPDKEEVVSLASLPELTYTEAEARLAVTLLRLCRLWIWADRHTEDGVLRDLSVTGVTLKCGGDVTFWDKVVELGWLERAGLSGVKVPGFSERFGRSARSRLLAANRKRRQRDRDKGERCHAEDANRHAKSALARDLSVTGVTPSAGQKRDVSRQPQPQPQPQPLSEPQGESPPQQEPPSTWSSSSRSSSARASGGGDEANETTDERDDDDQKNGGGITTGKLNWIAAAERANKVASKVGIRCRERGDRSLVLKVCALVESGRLPEGLLWDAVTGLIESKTAKQNHWAYLHRCLEEKAAGKGLVLNAMLASVDVPENMLAAPREAARA